MVGARCGFAAGVSGGGLAGGGRGGKSGSCVEVSVQDTGFAVLDLFFGGPSAALRRRRLGKSMWVMFWRGIPPDGYVGAARRSRWRMADRHKLGTTSRVLL